jgi:outer membrane protein assembly factor BamC
MVLKYKLDFDRAWATVGAALEDAKISVEDLDRTSAIYYVYYSSRHDPEPGFFSKVFGGSDSKEDSNPGHRFTVQLEPEGEEVRVTVGIASELAASDTDSLILKERLLKLIKEYST